MREDASPKGLLEFHYCKLCDLALVDYEVTSFNLLTRGPV